MFLRFVKNIAKEICAVFFATKTLQYFLDLILMLKYPQ